MTPLPVLVIGTLAVSSLFCLVRLLKGPSQSDRVAVLDLLTSLGVCGLLGFSILSDSTLLIDVAFLMGVLSPLSTIAFSYYLAREKIQ